MCIFSIYRLWPTSPKKPAMNNNNRDPDFDNMSSFFPCEIDDAIQYINLGYGPQAPK